MSILVVGRDRAHVKALTSKFPTREVVSASAFFDKVRMLTFLLDKKVIRDDYAPLVFAQRVLKKDARYPISYAAKFASLYSACYHGTMTPQEIWREVCDKPVEFKLVFEQLRTIDIAMAEANLVNGVSALFKAWHIIKDERIAPPGLVHQPVVMLQHLIDLTSLEIEVIKDLSRLGMFFHITFPLDFERRGLNAAVDFSAKLFEKSSDLTNIELSFDSIAQDGPLRSLVEGLFKEQHTVQLTSSQCSLTMPYDVIEEANSLAANVARLKATYPYDSIAIAVRTLDSRAKIYQHALKRFGLSVRDRKGVPLTETRAGLLLSTILSSKRSHLQKRDLIGLIHHPLCSFYVADVVLRSTIVDLIETLGIDDCIVASISGRYQELCNRMRERLHKSRQSQASLDILLRMLENIEDILGLLPMHDSFLGHLVGLLTVVKACFVDHENSSVSVLITTLNTLRRSKALSQDDPAISFNEFALLLELELLRITEPRPDVEDLNAVEFLLLPEFLGRSFDHIFIADISFGRMPQNNEPDPLMDDTARIALNTLCRKTVLRVFFDDPFEPLQVPPRQALEPFWFAQAIASAKTSIHFSCARHDDNGSEQAPSEFFLWLKDNLEIHDNETALPEPLFDKPESVRFFAALCERDEPEPTKSVVGQALRERAHAFHEGKVSDYAFFFSPRVMLEKFEGRLAQEPTRALTPTMVENFAACRFKGFLERILRLKEDKLFEDIDAQTIGQIAHKTLERYVAQKTKLSRDRFSELIKVVGDEFIDSGHIVNTDILRCHLDWLGDALYSLLAHIDQTFGHARAYNVATELAFGLENSRFLPVAINVNGRRYLIGGRIDRVDRIGDQYVVIDYKLSSRNALKAELSQRNILTRHFQMPIYMRLVAQHFAHHGKLDVSFSFASIRDGELLTPLEGNSIMRDRIFDDDGADGFAHAIDDIFAPLFEGNVVASAGIQCSQCHLHYVCRNREA